MRIRASLPQPATRRVSGFSKAHVSSMLTKLGLNNRTQIALFAHDAGLTS